MAFLYDLDETPMDNATRYISYVLQTIHDNPENTPLDRIEQDLQNINDILAKCKTTQKKID